MSTAVSHSRSQASSPGLNSNAATTAPSEGAPLAEPACTCSTHCSLDHPLSLSHTLQHTLAHSPHTALAGATSHCTACHGIICCNGCAAAAAQPAGCVSPACAHTHSQCTQQAAVGTCLRVQSCRTALEAQHTHNTTTRKQQQTSSLGCQQNICINPLGNTEASTTTQTCLANSLPTTHQRPSTAAST